MTVVTGDEQMQIVLARDDVDAAHQFGKEFAVQVGKDDTDGARAAATEAARGVVRDVLEFLRRVQDALAHGAGHVLLAVERARDGGHRDLGQPCYVANRDNVSHRRPTRSSVAGM
jgi:hypothetical protein